MDRINVNGQNGVATSANVNVKVNDTRANGGNFKWQVNAIKRITAWFDVYDLDMSGVNVDIIVNASEIAVNARYNGVEYHIDTPITAKTSMTKVDSIVADSFRSIVSVVCMEAIKNEIAENEQEQENEDIDYLVTIFNEKMVEDITKDFESTLQTIVEYGDNSGDLEHVCGGFNYERDYEHEWVEFYNENGNGGINHAYEIFRNAPSFTYVDFFNEDDACDLVYELADEYGVGVDDNCCEDCLVWVKNPYYNAPKNDTPCLDIDIAVDRVVNTIEKYLGSYTPSYLDQFGDCVITIGWDEFSEKDMQMLIEDDVFEGLVIDSLVGENISDVLVYDDGVYVTVDYDKTFDKSNVLNTLRREYALCDVDEYEMPINTLADRCGGYHVGLSDTGSIYVMYNKESDTYYVNGLGEDDDFAINEKLTSKTSYMELYDMITECIENNVNELKWVNETFFKSEIIENALESAIDSDDEYYDDAICQIGDWYVNYTSPCEEFPEGCVLVVDEKGCMYGNWCDVSDVDFAVEYLVGMIEKLNNEFNKVA